MIALAAAGRNARSGVVTLVLHRGVVVIHGNGVVTLGGMVHRLSTVGRPARGHGHARQALEGHGDGEKGGDEESDKASHEQLYVLTPMGRSSPAHPTPRRVFVLHADSQAGYGEDAAHRLGPLGTSTRTKPMPRASGRSGPW